MLESQNVYGFLRYLCVLQFKRMKALALVVGNADYPLDKNRLDNAVNDASDFADKLEALQFKVIRVLNCISPDFDRALANFEKELKHYDIGLFFYSGHALQIKGRNYLTALDTGFQDEVSAKRTSIGLNDVIEHMENAAPTIKIIILDACRNNPYTNQFRGVGNEGLAPVYAPKGSIIAFSTSPGQVAMDGGSGKNSVYTGALLNHIGDRDIPIEEFFKRVRTSVYASTNGKQTSWEHTSMIGNFSFNAGQMIHSVALPYRPDYIADREYISEGRDIDPVIEGLREHVWDTQNGAIRKLYRIDKKNIDANSKFLLGRNLLQAATGGAFDAIDMMNDFRTWLPRYSDGDLNHVLNGILFETYFDSKGEFRKDNINNAFIDNIFEIQARSEFSESFKFIKEQLSPFSEYLFWIPGNPKATVPIEANFERKEEIGFGDKPGVKYKLISVRHAGTELLQSGYSSSGCDFETFRKRVASALSVPLKLVRLSVNIKEVETSTRLSVPSPFRLSRIPEVTELEGLDF